jgi:hypothetical protein
LQLLLAIAFSGLVGIFLLIFCKKPTQNFLITTDIADHIPTVTLCSYDVNVTNIENLMLIDCKIKRSQYLEHEQCVMENFYRSRNDCKTFNNSLSKFTNENQLVGMHFIFKSNLKEDQYYAVIILKYHRFKL